MRRITVMHFIALLSGCLVQCACATVDVRLADFMSPDRSPRSATLPRGYAVQDLTIHRGERLIGITHAHHPQSRSVIVFCGGDVFHRSLEGGAALESLALGADVILFDYPGYGDTTGTPTTGSILDTALAVYDYASALETSAGKKRVLYGFSLGGLVAAQVARERPVDGVVLEASAASAEAWARSHIPWIARPLISPQVEPGLAGIDSVRALARFSGRVLVLASPADRQAPAGLSADIERRLHAAGVSVQLVRFPHARHGDINQSAQFVPVLRGFLDHLQEPSWSAVRD
ncbi:MAG TPA: alpha/beta fold hydrolase [Steroidobacteraceae bacterium]|jgi:pimeloyl-ACP methyl ester carboxylesterase